MFNSKTYFEQVPLEFVKQILEGQIRTKETGETMEGIDKKKSRKELRGPETRSILRTRKVAQVESLN